VFSKATSHGRQSLSRRAERRGRLGDEAGITLLELLISVFLLLIMIIAVYSFLYSNKQEYVAETDLATAQNAGRSAIDIFTCEVMEAGYNPLGVPFVAVPETTAYKVRFLADLNGNGIVGTASELDENLTYEFVDADGDNIYELRRGIDLNGDGDYADTGESVTPVATYVVPIDLNGDGSPEPFLAYDAAAPDTHTIRIVFGVRTEHYDILRRRYPVVRFVNEIMLRNTG
jgi:hypothetical protein